LPAIEVVPSWEFVGLVEEHVCMVCGGTGEDDSDTGEDEAVLSFPEFSRVIFPELGSLQQSHAYVYVTHHASRNLQLSGECQE